jgi:hypothetical protein
MDVRPWSVLDDADLTVEFIKGTPVAEIARLLGRSPASIECRLRQQVFDLDSLRGGPPRRAYTPWTPTADWQLIVEYHNGGTVAELAELFGRSPGAIRSRLLKVA